MLCKCGSEVANLPDYLSQPKGVRVRCGRCARPQDDPVGWVAADTKGAKLRKAVSVAGVRNAGLYKYAKVLSGDEG